MLLRRYENREQQAKKPAVPIKKEKSLEEMTVDELKAYAEEKGIDIGQSTSQKGILKKILEAE